MGHPLEILGRKDTSDIVVGYILDMETKFTYPGFDPQNRILPAFPSSGWQFLLTQSLDAVKCVHGYHLACNQRNPALPEFLRGCFVSDCEALF